MAEQIVFNEDCMLGMKEYADGYFDLAIVDPPYGININNNIGRRKGDKKSDYPKAYWDSSVPDKTYFDELFRVSKKAIIWGGTTFNYRRPSVLSCGESQTFQRM